MLNGEQLEKNCKNTETQGKFGKEPGKKDALLPGNPPYLLCYVSKMFNITSYKHRFNNNCKSGELKPF